MNFIRNNLISFINSIRQGLVGSEEPRLRNPSKDQYTESQRRAVYRLRQYRTRIGEQF